MSLYRPAGAKPTRTFGPVVKRDYVRNPALREAYRLIPCQNCGAEDGTVCCAHSNWAERGGKGGHIKSSDEMSAALCSVCHALIDQGSTLALVERQRLWWDAHVRSVRRLVNLGLWPAKVAVPDLLTCPWGFATVGVEA